VNDREENNRTERKKAIEDQPFADGAVRSLFHVLCQKWLGDKFAVRFLIRSEWEKRGSKILEKDGVGKETLFIPEDVGMREMETILETAGKPKGERITRRNLETPRNALANFLFEKGVDILAEKMPFDSLLRHVKNALLHWKQGQKTLYEAFPVQTFRKELEEVKKTGDADLVADKELEIADKIQMVVREFPFLLNCQHPAELTKEEMFNCRGASLLGGALMDEIGIKYLVGDVPRHSILVLVLSNGAIEWRDMMAPNFNEFITSEMIGGISKTGAPLTYEDVVAYAKDPTPDGLMIDILGDEYLRKLSWVKKGQRQFLTLFPPKLGSQMQILNGIAFALNELGYKEKEKECFGPTRKNDYFRQAVEACKLSTGYDPLYQYAYNTMGSALRELGEFEEAIRAYRRSSTVNSTNTACYFGLGEAEAELGQTEEAVRSFERYIELADEISQSYWIGKAKERIKELKAR